MEPISPEQTVQLARIWKEAARWLNAYQVSHWCDFTTEQHIDLNAFQTSLLHRAQDLEAGVVRPALVQIDQLLVVLQRVGVEARRPHPMGANGLLTVFNAGAVLVALAAAVARSNARAVQNALRELSELLA